MLFEKVANEEALLEVGVQIILDLLGAANLDPVTLGCGPALLVDEADWVRVALPNAIHILQVPARDEDLHLVA